MQSTTALRRLLPLALPLMMTACGTLTTGTNNPRSIANMDPDQVIRELSKPICADAWKPLTYSSSKDTPETVEGVRSNNRARKAFCHE
jgi:hypothetical protein